MRNRDWLCFCFLMANLFAAMPALAEDVKVSTYYPSPYGVYKRLEVDEAPNASPTAFTDNLINNGINIVSTYSNQTYLPGLFWSTSDDNAGQYPTAGIWAFQTDTGTSLYLAASFGTQGSTTPPVDLPANLRYTGVVLKGDGAVGVGTKSPEAALHVKCQLGTPGIPGDPTKPAWNAARFEGLSGSSNRNFISLCNADPDLWWDLSNEDADGGGAANGLAFREKLDKTQPLSAPIPKNCYLFNPQSPVRLYLAPGGNVGIGTTKPSSLLEIRGTNSSAVFQDISPGTSFLSLSNRPGLLAGNSFFSNLDFNGKEDHPIARIGMLETEQGSLLFFGTGHLDSIDNQAIVIDKEGNVGIGMPQQDQLPQTILDVVGHAIPGPIGDGIQFNGPPQLDEELGERGRLYATHPGNFGGNQAVLTISEGLATNDNDEILIAPAVLAASNPPTSNPVGHIQLVARQVHLTAPGGIFLDGPQVVVSDARLKSDMKPIPDALQKISFLKGVNFRWKDPRRGQRMQMGIIAQDVEKVFPELVVVDPQDGMKRVAYVPLTAALIESIKELKAKNEALEKRLNEIEHRKS